MYRDDKYACENIMYAQAYVKPQTYKNLFSCSEGFLKGTIFKDLYMPYKKNEKC